MITLGEKEESKDESKMIKIAFYVALATKIVIVAAIVTAIGCAIVKYLI